MTQLEMARAGEITPQMELVARQEKINPSQLRDLVARGQVVILSNRLRWDKISGKSQAINDHEGRCLPKFICGVGTGLATKVNANLGTSSDYTDPNEELAKLRVAEEAGADAVMDLSTGGDIPKIRETLLEHAKIAFGTVPIYEAALSVKQKNFSASSADKTSFPNHSFIKNLTEETIFKTIENQAKAGVDFMTVHCGVTRAVLKDLEEDNRVAGIVSRGGTILAAWMKLTGQENPFYEKFNRVLEIAREYDVTLSLGDGLRPGALADAFDRAQVHELLVLAELGKKARTAGVQVMIEGPGHVPLNQIQAQVQLQKRLCDGAPLYVLGPIVTDRAPGYDHITSAIGGALAAWAGADFICYVTPMEHLGLPLVEHVREGVIAARIAAHAADIAKGVPGAWEDNKRFSEYRRKQDWTHQISESLDPKKAKELRESRKPAHDKVCSMCGDLCVYSLMQDK
ncbi:MAG: phosphomethylpyrimidine synthase ThiC [Planctomycetota bacterium]